MGCELIEWNFVLGERFVEQVECVTCGVDSKVADRQIQYVAMLHKDILGDRALECRFSFE